MTSLLPTPSHPDEDLSLDLTAPLAPERRFFEQGMTVVAFLLSILALLPLGSILVEILQRGSARLSGQTLTSLPAPMGMEGVADGIGNAIQGTLIMVALAAVVSIPIGVLTAVFLAEFSKGKAASNVVRFIITVLSGVPSIVVGVFAWGVIVFNTKQFSMYAGAFALAIVMLPIIALSAEEALKLVPTTQRLASAGLGASRFQTIIRVVIPSALAGILTGVLLAVARAAGETAPLLFTALFSENWMTSLGDPSASLPVLIYNYANSPFPSQNDMAWTASLVLLALVLISNIISRLIVSPIPGKLKQMLTGRN